ncbi:HAD-IIIC family phosphatase [Bacillus cereus group sp. MYBK108-2]|uniref:HAD-IIIC family phosphatase n=1 Tax=unclassified Bacillus cereus group TaxID=2750818 RepID=UPI00288FF552|nr:HAD-IIIC family phosphatase [Bacillus cereus]MDA2307627.1 HAD-IIIC family phosphatase [Bacillus cereus]HDX9634240.1 HAD-IIIC family phosphatase [Bacillus cereus]HEF1897127.1 HAD-IIIC family phosphatase [Bacillus cereus]
MLTKVKTNPKVKCVVWDLDNTIWKGILLEDTEVVLKDGVLDIIQELDNRGILQSISSRNEHDIAIGKLKELHIDHYFLYPQISWNPKSEGIAEIAKQININVDTLAFIDDQPFELEEVNYALPQVLTINAEDIYNILDFPELKPKFITVDSKNRRELYMNDIKRKEVEKEFKGTPEKFLETLNMTFTISNVGDDDLKRAEELTVRTNQLNATGYTYSYEELNQLRKVNKMFIADLNDKYGSYGKIGLTMIETNETTWNIKLLLMSCRVMSRGVGTVLLHYIMQKAKEAGVKLIAEFVPTDRNRMMYVTYKFAGFKEIEKCEDGTLILENDLNNLQAMPSYITLLEG